LRAGPGTFQPEGPLPVVPPSEDDETVTSLLDRTASFYGRSLGDLLNRAGRSSGALDLAAVDIGTPPAALKSVAAVLGVDLERLAASTIVAGYPWATRLVARAGHVRHDEQQPGLRYAACPHCLEAQSLARGVSWIRRAWLFAVRTVCPIHHVRLAPMKPGGAAHPVWSGFMRRHREASRSVCAAVGGARVSAIAADPSQADDPAAVLHREMASVQETILAEAARGQGEGGHRQEGRAAAVNDLAWAFTRADRNCPDRLVYEALSSELLDSAWHMARRRRPGPVDFVALSLDERHLLLATATVLAGPPSLRQLFHGPPGSWNKDLAVLNRRLRDADRAELRERERRWTGLS
jgi:hypothetical protein